MIGSKGRGGGGGGGGGLFTDGAAADAADNLGRLLDLPLGLERGGASGVMGMMMLRKCCAEFLCNVY